MSETAGAGGAGGTDQEPTAAPYPSAGIGNVIAAMHELGHPTQIGPYHILEPIGEGGMGTVYKAQQREPISRIVALKIIKLGMDTRQVIARFESEQQALAVMNHVNVAKVLDAGATESGRPYFVMEYVAGEPITTYADRHRLTVPQRLELFAQACHAVQHAHQKGIIHRDIKPSNILVTMQDDKPLVKVIDFGVAKAMAQRLTERTLFTESGQLVGTPEYMSPEQAESQLAIDIDTRTDVYSLGVVLYELLSGALPFDTRSLRIAGYNEIQRIIREVDPPPPSTRLSTMKDALPSVAASRQIEPRKLGTLLRGELDWIVMKCLEKDRTRRYDSAAALAGDVARYLADEPVAASPPSQIYRMRKFVRRHKWGLGVSATLVLLLGAGLVGTTLGFVNARRQRDIAVAARLAEAEAREYERQTDRFLIEMFTSIDPAQSRGREVPVREILDRATQRIDAQPPQHRIVEAYLRKIFGAAYRSLGLLDQAERQLRRALELDSPIDEESRRRISSTLNDLGLTLRDKGRMADAEPKLRRAYELRRSTGGADHPDTLATQSNLADVLMHLETPDKLSQAETLLSDAIDRIKRVTNIDAEARISAFNNLAMLRLRQGKVPQAEAIFRDALADARARGGQDHPMTIGLMNNLAELLRRRGDAAAAADLLAEAYELSRKVNGQDHPDTITIGNNVALAYTTIGRFDDAEKIYTDAIERRRRTLGEDDPGTLLLRGNHALLLQQTGRLADAEAVFRDVLDRLKRTVGEHHLDTITAQSNLAWAMAARGDLPGAESLYRQTIATAQQMLGPDHPAVALFGMKLGYILTLQSRWSDAEPLLADGYNRAAAMGITSISPVLLAAYGQCLANLNQPRDALAVLERADAAAEQMPTADPQLLRRIATAMAMAHEQLGDTRQAGQWRDRAAHVTTRPSTSPDPAGSIQNPASRSSPGSS